MDSSMNHFISDQLHVAQQSRREKLRVQHCSPSGSDPRKDDYSSSFEVVQSSFDPDMVQIGDNMGGNANMLCRQVGCSSEMPNVSENNALGALNSINMVSSSIDGSLKTRVDSNLESRGVWKSVSANSCADNRNTEYIGRYSKSNSLERSVSDLSAFEMKGNHHQHQSSQYGDMNNFAKQLHYKNNALSDGVTTAVIGLQSNCNNARGSTCISWGSYGGDNRQVLNAPYAYQSDAECLLNGSSWNTEMSLLHARSSQMVVDSHSQGLSLSLCSYPAGSMITGSQYGNTQHIPQSIPPDNVATVAFHDSKPCSPPNFVRTVSVGQGTSLHDPGGPLINYHRQTGPLGPFTGYATILKSSRFLTPVQQLLDEYCGVIEKFASSSTRVAPDIDLSESCDLATAVNSIASDVVTSSEKAASAATQQGFEETSKGAANNARESNQPDYKAKISKLLYMLGEVSRRYKQYYQQMQMVASSFESVAGLAGATPYISLALKAVSCNFNHLKNSISDQLRQIKTFLGEDSSLPHTGIMDKGNFNSKRLKNGDHSFQKHKYGGSSMGLLEPQQHIWRPQRGLPERAVSVLRAWLFEHFLHPYPTDTDKHMLATQTGLTRSQVSNWFINARVRLWKPMVEEVHMLEMKGAVETNINPCEVEDELANGADVNLKVNHTLYEMAGDVCVAKQRDQEKHSRDDSNSHNMTRMNEGMLGNSRYYQTAHDISGIGSISLTLGLRQSADQLYRLEGNHLPYLQHQDCVQQHLGGHATHEYAG